MRTAEPNYIGVREPQYTTAVGLIKQACKKDRMHKQQTASQNLLLQDQIKIPFESQKPTQTQKQKEATAKKQGESKFKKILGYFFE